MLYLKKFNTDAERKAFTENYEYVAYTEETNIVEINRHDYSQDYLTFVIRTNGTINFSGTSLDNTVNTISYSLDNGENWSEQSNNVEISVNKGDNILIKGGFSQSFEGPPRCGTFSQSTAEFDVEGNIMSLIYGDDYQNKYTLNINYVFFSLFGMYNDQYSAKVINAKNLVLPATTLAMYCYSTMFKGCTSLTTAPQLPATTLATGCYCDMFNGCTSLTTSPQLPATTLANNCYSRMFNATNVLPDCTNIDFTNQTVVASGGLEGLFAGTKVSDNDLSRILPINPTTNNYWLPVTTLAYNCYSNMFNGCTSLTTAPELPATTLTSNCYSNMFNGCTSLTTAPELKATTLANNCYHYMFSGCTNLNYIKAMFTTEPTTKYTNNWVSGVASSGTFVKNASATWTTTGVNGIPSGWTVKTTSN